MPISALVLTLDESPGPREGALQALQQDSRLECGSAFGNRLPVVASTTTLSEGRTLCEQLQSLVGVHFVDVVSINFEDSEPSKNASSTIS